MQVERQSKEQLDDRSPAAPSVPTAPPVPGVEDRPRAKAPETSSKLTRIYCWVNDRRVALDQPPGRLVLDVVREHLGQIGTKEGCREGDCGACVVLVGRLEEGQVRYLPITSCLMPVVELEGCHLVTVEGLDVGRPSPVQRSIVDAGASQCGFCTPGIAVSLTAMVLEDVVLEDVVLEDVVLEEGAAQEAAAGQVADSVATAERALSGHLCRCTGYRSLRHSALEILAANVRGLDALVDHGWIPEYFRQMPARLAELETAPQTIDDEPVTMIAGGTDLYVQRGEQLATGRVLSLASRPELRGIERLGDRIVMGAMTTFEDLAQSSIIQREIPGIVSFMDEIASWQIRNRATVGGNLVNASPIGDVTILMLALGAELELSLGESRRTLPLGDFYGGYKVIDLEPGEIVERVSFASRVGEADVDDRVDFQKVAKRRSLDIATVNAAVRIRRHNGEAEAEVTHAALAVGGVAPIPLLLANASASLVGQPLSLDSLKQALQLADAEIAPIDDVRGSAAYKRLLVRQLLTASFLALYPDIVSQPSHLA